MGNVFNRNEVQLEDPDQLIEDNNNNQINRNIIPPKLKTIIKVKNPFYLLKETFHLEKDSIKNIYYIKFRYDSLLTFNCYINFNVKKNTERNNLKQKDDYELCFIPTDKFVEKNIVINNLSKGKNQEFYNEKAFLDFEYFEQNSTRRKEESGDYEEEEEEDDDDDDIDNINNVEVVEGVNKTEQNEENEALINMNNNNQNNTNNNNEVENNINNEEYEEYEDIYDIGIEFVPCYEKDSIEYEQNKENNEIIFISLFNIEKKENNEIDIKCVMQKLKKHNYYFEIKDIYDGSGNNGKCIICYTNNRNTIFVNCGHSCCCKNCADALLPKICPLCKNIIEDIICLKKDLVNNISENDKDKNIIENNEKNKDNEPIKSINEI